MNNGEMLMVTHTQSQQVPFFMFLEEVATSQSRFSSSIVSFDEHWESLCVCANLTVFCGVVRLES